MKAERRWRIATIIVTILTVIFTPVVIYTEFKHRGYFAFGGEWFLYLMPLAVQGIKSACKDIKEILN